MLKNKSNLLIVVLIVLILIVIVAIINVISANVSSIVQEDKNIKLKSKVLKSVIENNWKADYNFGTKESIFDEYDIYFDEGIEVKCVDDKIYNLVFTEKYGKNIISNVKSNDSLEDIISELGNPDFGGKSINLIGYKLDEYYVFFNGNQASIYRNEDVEVKDVDVFSKEYSSKKEFIAELTANWTDFDVYTENSSDDTITFAQLNYAYKGIKVSVIDNEINLTVYNNCTIKIPQNDIYIINTKNKNLIYESENDRQNSIHNRKFAYAQYQSSVNNVPPGFENIDESEIVYKVIESSKFIAIQKDMKSTGEYKLMFVNIDGRLPNAEMDGYINSNIWLDDYNIIYGIKDKGIYLYNLQTKEKTILKEGNGNYIIHGLTKDNKLDYDDNQIDINI